MFANANVKSEHPDVFDAYYQTNIYLMEIKPTTKYNTLILRITV